MKEENPLPNWIMKIDRVLNLVVDLDQFQWGFMLIEMPCNIFQLVIMELQFHMSLSCLDGGLFIDRRMCELISC